MGDLQQVEQVWILKHFVVFKEKRREIIIQIIDVCAKKTSGTKSVL